MPIVRAGLEAAGGSAEALFELSLYVESPRCAFLDHVHFQAPYGIGRNPYLGTDVHLTGFTLHLVQGVFGIEELEVSEWVGECYRCSVRLRSPITGVDFLQPSFGDELHRHIRQVVFGERA